MICPRCQLGDLQPGDTCSTCGYVIPADESPEFAMLKELERVARGELEALFEVERVLGRGGMSVVLLAREAELKRYVAVKVLPLQLSFAPDAAERFKREARISASLDHPHIVPVHRVGATPRLLWYSMKYVRGTTLATHLAQRGPLPVDLTARVIARAADALAYAHGKGVVHRDVKPGNVMLDERGWVWVTDFGVAKAFGNVPLTQTGGALGTPGYMAPEQYYGRELDGRADQYSLAVVTWECLAGTPPFVADSLGEYVHKHCHVPAPDIRTIRRDVPEPVARALLRALSKAPEERFPSVTEFADALGAPRDSLGLPHVPAATEVEVPTASPMAGPAAGVTTPTTPTSPTLRMAPPPPPPPGHRARRVAALAAVLVVVTAGLLALPERTSTPAPAPTDAPTDTGTATPPADSVPAAADTTPPEPATGILVISTVPIGRLLIDGRPAGESFRPAGVTVRAGRRVIRVTRANFVPWTDTIVVRAGDTVRRLAIPLRPLQ